MTHAELLRKHATDATNEGGVWFSGEYMSMLATVAESMEAENAKLRELVLYMWDFSCVVPDEPHTSKEELDYSAEVWKRMREFGIGVDE